MQQCGVRFFRYFHFKSDAPTDQVLLWSNNQNIDWGFVLLSSSLQQQAEHQLGFFYNQFLLCRNEQKNWQLGVCFSIDFFFTAMSRTLTIGVWFSDPFPLCSNKQNIDGQSRHGRF
jgi:hypothetical protein